MRRWLWPYAILAVVLTAAGAATIIATLNGLGDARLFAKVAAADAVVIEPAKRALIYLLDIISPFDLPGWIKGLYANLVVLAVAAMALSLVMGVLLLPVFYAVYRGSRPE